MSRRPGTFGHILVLPVRRLEEAKYRRLRHSVFDDSSGAASPRLFVLHQYTLPLPAFCRHPPPLSQSQIDWNVVTLPHAAPIFLMWPWTWTLGILIDINVLSKRQLLYFLFFFFLFFVFFFRPVPANTGPGRVSRFFGVDTVQRLDEFKVAVWNKDVSGSFLKE